MKDDVLIYSKSGHALSKEDILHIWDVADSVADKDTPISDIFDPEVFGEPVFIREKGPVKVLGAGKK